MACWTLDTAAGVSAASDAGDGRAAPNGAACEANCWRDASRSWRLTLNKRRRPSTAASAGVAGAALTECWPAAATSIKTSGHIAARLGTKAHRIRKVQKLSTRKALDCTAIVDEWH